MATESQTELCLPLETWIWGGDYWIISNDSHDESYMLFFDGVDEIQLVEKYHETVEFKPLKSQDISSYDMVVSEYIEAKVACIMICSIHLHRLRMANTCRSKVIKVRTNCISVTVIAVLLRRIVVPSRYFDIHIFSDLQTKCLRDISVASGFCCEYG